MSSFLKNKNSFEHKRYTFEHFCSKKLKLTRILETYIMLLGDRDGREGNVSRNIR